MHLLCTICSDLLNQSENIYVIKCGHLFHYHCIKQWISRSKSCPQCRINVTERCMFRLYPTISNDVTVEDVTTLQSRLDDLQLQLRQEKSKCNEKDNQIKEFILNLKKIEDSLQSSEKKLVEKTSAVIALKDQLKYVQIQNKEVHKLKSENAELNKYVKTSTELNKVLNACYDEVEKMIQDYADIRTLATFATALKRALCDSEKKKKQYWEQVHLLKQKLASEKATVQTLQSNLDQLMSLNVTLTPHDAPKLTQFESRAEPENTDSFKREVVAPGPSVNSIVKSDSPYLSLKQSSLPLTALQRRPKQQLLDKNLKPSEFALFNSIKTTCQKFKEQEKDSIFHKKEKPEANFFKENVTDMDTSYDGLGGHSKMDIFPQPSTSNTTRIPKISAKHKLKRPNSQDLNEVSINKYFKKL
ncbi:E3 ubiquitin-protein ligase TRAIP [Pieris rapae]|uniref:E3 ubiquitin-protein ligase TRAIP n=1 Tax=Pieris rapae TaxID=64459 RepID=UPI001E27A7CD|nr:E3 ubiquitin-protein ligase TRAIP [Pieris rapae]